MSAPQPNRDARIAELYELEEAAYGGLMRRIERYEEAASRTPLSVRALLAHVNESLDALRPMAEGRGVSLFAPVPLLADTLGRIRERVLERFFARWLGTPERGTQRQH